MNKSVLGLVRLGSSYKIFPACIVGTERSAGKVITIDLQEHSLSKQQQFELQQRFTSIRALPEGHRQLTVGLNAVLRCSFA